MHWARVHGHLVTAADVLHMLKLAASSNMSCEATNQERYFRGTMHACMSSLCNCRSDPVGRSALPSEVCPLAGCCRAPHPQNRPQSHSGLPSPQPQAAPPAVLSRLFSSYKLENSLSLFLPKHCQTMLANARQCS